MSEGSRKHEYGPVSGQPDYCWRELLARQRNRARGPFLRYLTALSAMPTHFCIVWDVQVSFATWRPMHMLPSDMLSTRKAQHTPPPN